MRDILLGLVILAIFLTGYYIMRNVDKFFNQYK